MAQQPGPLPQPSIPWIDKPGTPSLSFRQYFLAFDAVVRGLFAFFGSATIDDTDCAAPFMGATQSDDPREY